MHASLCAAHTVLRLELFTTEVHRRYLSSQLSTDLGAYNIAIILDYRLNTIIII